MVVPQPHKRPRSSYIRFAAELPNQRWQADLTHWQLADGTGVEILDILDDHSRYAVGSVARTVFKAADVLACFLLAADRHGLPESLLTDNGAVFTAAPRRGRCALETELAALGIEHAHSRPYHPQTCSHRLGRRSNNPPSLSLCVAPMRQVRAHGPRIGACTSRLAG
jgi:transposase InsO family protein